MLKNSLLLASLISFSFGAADAATPRSPYVPSGYIQTFDDEFKSLSTISPGPGPYAPGVNWYNGVKQCCVVDTTNGRPAVMYPTAVNGASHSPYAIENGSLAITLSLINNVWYSGVLTSVASNGEGFAQEYGYFEIRAKLPSGAGTWPAFWMLSLNGLTAPRGPGPFGEADIFEEYGGRGPGFMTTYHDWTTGTVPYQNWSNTSSLTSAFHIWGFLWTPTAMTVYLDGKLMNTTSTPPVMQQPYYLVVDLGLGGGWPTGNTPPTNTMLVDYIRAYQAP
jgi:Glycosyl hydrolases family 16